MDAKCKCATSTKKCITNLVITSPKKKQKHRGKAQHKILMHATNNHRQKHQARAKKCVILLCKAKANLVNGRQQDFCKNETPDQFFLK